MTIVAGTEPREDPGYTWAVGDPEEKRLKAAAKRDKKAAKAALKAAKKQPAVAPAGAVESGDNRSAPATAGPSPAVRFAESVRGILYVLLGTSLVIALILGQRGVIVSLDDLIDSLFAARAGKVVLTVLAIALTIYGLKHLRIIR